MNFEPLTTFIRNTFDQAGKHTAVIGLSGGIDSATSYLLTVKALGPEHVEAFYLPTKTSHPVHLQDINFLLQPPTSRFHLFPIGSIIQKSWRVINKIKSTADQPPPPNSSPDSTTKLRLANLTARIRMMILFDQAKKFDALVVGTENKSEAMLGYYTRYGDEASDLEPIGHLYKTEVIDLAKSLGVPSSIIDKPPSADLWPGQTDAKELGFTYAQADPILKLIDQHQTKAEIIQAGFEESLTDAVLNQVTSTTFKHQVPYRL